MAGEYKKEYHPFVNWLGDLGRGAVDIFDNVTGETNYSQQQRTYDYQKNLNALTMNREDSAVQRRVKDLEKAGYNPLLALGGQGAQSSTMLSGKAPQKDNYLNTQIAYESINKIRQDIINSKSQTSLNQKQTTYMDHQIANSMLDAMLKSQKYGNFGQENIRKWIQSIVPIVGAGVGASLFKSLTGKKTPKLNSRPTGSYKKYNKDTGETYQENYYELLPGLK